MTVTYSSICLYRPVQFPLCQSLRGQLKKMFLLISRVRVVNWNVLVFTLNDFILFEAVNFKRWGASSSRTVSWTIANVFKTCLFEYE